MSDPSFELFLPDPVVRSLQTCPAPQVGIRTQKKTHPFRIQWTPEMLDYLRANFPIQYTPEIVAYLQISRRTIERKAIELGLAKEPGFLEKRRETISKMAVAAHPGNPHKGVRGWAVPNSENTRFKPGHIPAIVTNPEIRIKCTALRNETIRNERLRLKYGLPQNTKMKLDPYAKPKIKQLC